ncbi:MAG: Gfo/Idh/MocA family oxidoreductase, partial [Phycisphaerales bacterium]|nr:Gfo/Idh/MocA family oxidoreductase [Phycisphaerales bacterium]
MLTRRQFIERTSLAAGAALLAPLAGMGTTRKLRLAAIGTQNRAWANISGLSDHDFVALCDVDAGFLERTASQFPGAKTFKDFRVLLDTVEGLDAVVVSTPDHLHAPVASMALRRGLHVYCEKPLTHTVAEARRLASLSKGLVTQMGTQIHAGSNYRRVVELVQSGAIGPVREVHVWCNKSWSDGRFGPASSAPASLDWDLWLGPAPLRPYSEGVHPANWRRFWEYGTGTLGDMGCHYIDLVYWALDLDHPVHVRAEGPPPHEVGTPAWCVVTYEFPARGARAPVRMTWYDGPNRRPSQLQGLKHADGSDLSWGDGHLFIGDDGMILSDYGRHHVIRDGRVVPHDVPPRTIPDSIGHH